ncbi:hypothetical protein J132_10820 [Termitomyces sp. J132]|nr:hypothetical protein J132_10820 [Termitomyces sp. J132]
MPEPYNFDAPDNQEWFVDDLICYCCEGLLVYTFGLAIRLWVVGSGGVELHSKQLVELPGELCHKLWAPIRDVGIREAVELLDISLIHVCGAHSGAGGVGQNEVCLLAIQVYHHYDCIITMGVGELYNEVHKSHAPLFCRHGQWVALSIWESVLGLGLETEIACTSVGFNIPGHLEPPVVLQY